MVTIAKPSQKANETSRGKIPKLYEFPFDSVPIGHSFFVGTDEVKNIAVMRTLASRYGKQLGRKFKVVSHYNDAKDLVQIEVFYKEDRAGGVPASKNSKAPIVGIADSRYDETGDLIGRWKG